MWVDCHSELIESHGAGLDGKYNRPAVEEETSYSFGDKLLIKNGAPKEAPSLNNVQEVQVCDATKGQLISVAGLIKITFLRPYSLVLEVPSLVSSRFS
jgi:hypothetical protein